MPATTAADCACGTAEEDAAAAEGAEDAASCGGGGGCCTGIRISIGIGVPPGIGTECRILAREAAWLRTGLVVIGGSDVGGGVGGRSVIEGRRAAGREGSRPAMRGGAGRVCRGFSSSFRSLGVPGVDAPSESDALPLLVECSE